LAASLGAGVLSGASDSIVRFDAGVAAYARHDYGTAREAFHDVARVDLRGADAWANFGTAAWAAGDTADAVAGWQRALRLEPLATDLRDRIELAHGVPVGSAGFVPPAPLSAVGFAAMLLWVGGWGFAAARAARGRQFATPS